MSTVNFKIKIRYALKKIFWYLLGFPFKISDENYTFLNESRSPGFVSPKEMLIPEHLSKAESCFQLVGNSLASSLGGLVKKMAESF